MKPEDASDAGTPPVQRPVRPALPEREAARVYAELREMGYTWHQAHETMQRIAAERERLAAALMLAADRLERLSLEIDDATRLHYEAKEWAQEARKASRA